MEGDLDIFSRPQVQKILLICKICFSEQIFTVDSHWAPLLTVYPFHYQYGKFYIFLLKII